MAKRRPGAFDELRVDGPELSDHSADLWERANGEVARKLLTSAVRCFATKGFQATTTRDISGGAGLSPAAMYVHFSSKEEMLFEISRTGHRHVLRTLRDVEPAEPVEHLRSLVFSHVVWHARHHVAARVNQYELANLTPEHYEVIRALRQEDTGVFRAAVERGIADGRFASTRVDRVVRAIMALSIDLVRWYRLDGADTPEELGAFYADLAIAMLTRG
ncbi:MAG TPA: TetR/AcrR family transcriptional regulator [Amycolatopsis sp.]|jgi:AcrR family transcriptional regulator|nr:TetR/AcrR family transcriptional regulator [Amycolatopsis sp.]